MACWYKNTEDSSWSLSLLVETKVFMLTSIDEKVVPLSGMLRRLCATKDYTCTLIPWEGIEPEISMPT